MIRRRFSLSRLLGLGEDRPAPEPSPSADFLNPYEPASAGPAEDIDAETARLAGERFRREYTPLFGETVAATGTDPHNSQAGLQAWKGAVR